MKISVFNFETSLVFMKHRHSLRFQAFYHFDLILFLCVCASMCVKYTVYVYTRVRVCAHVRVCVHVPMHARHFVPV